MFVTGEGRGGRVFNARVKRRVATKAGTGQAFVLHTPAVNRERPPADVVRMEDAQGVPRRCPRRSRAIRTHSTRLTWIRAYQTRRSYRLARRHLYLL